MARPTTVSTHSRPKAAGLIPCFLSVLREFQHTAARRRLVMAYIANKPLVDVSTHSRPKAAGNLLALCLFLVYVSTHSRPKAAGVQETRLW